MGFALLWMESQALALLFIAVVYAVSGKIGKRWGRVVLRAIAFLLPLFWGGAYVLAAGLLRSNNIKPDWLLAYAISWTICFLCGFFLIRRFALKEKGAVLACGSWSRPVLCCALGIVLTFLVITYLKMDLDARAQLMSGQTRGLAKAVRVKPAPIPYDKNGARIYQQAFDGIHLPHWASRIESPGFVPSIGNTKAVLKKNQPAMSSLNLAAQAPNVSFMPDPATDRHWPSYEAQLPPVHGAILASRLLGLDAFLKTANGDTKAALASIGAIGRMALLFSRTPYLIANGLSGRLIETRKAVLERSLAFSPEIHKEQMPVSTKPEGFLFESFLRALVMEQAMFLYSFSRDISTKSLCDLLFMGGNDAFEYIFCILPYRIFMLDSELRFHDRFWKKTYDFLSQPVYQRFQKHQEWEKEMMKHPGGIISALALARFSKVSLSPFVGEANLRLSEVAVAAAAYHWDKGAYPLRIDNLAPDYMAHIPMDPFDGKPLKMTGNALGVTFYSIGPDFKDNGGAVTFERPDGQKASGDIVFRLGAAYDQAFLKPALPQLAANGNMMMVQRALAAGADVNQNFPLVAAAAAGHSDIVRLLLEKGADIDVMTRVPKKTGKRGKEEGEFSFTEDDRIIGGMTALMAAAVNGREKTLLLLLNGGANPRMANPKGRNALIVAQGIGLLKAGEWMSGKLENIKRAKMEIKSLDVRVKALKAKADGLFKSDESLKALTLAESRLSRTRRHVEDWEAPNGPLTHVRGEPAASESFGPRTDITQRLLAAGSDIRGKDKLGITALMAAAFDGDMESVRLLIFKGADINSRNHFGWTPLIVARARGNLAIEKLLIDEGAIPGAKDDEIVNRLMWGLEQMKTAPQRKRKK